MTYKFEVEFEVESLVDDELTKDAAMNAIEMAVFNSLCFTGNGQDVVDSVIQHSEGFGECRVSVVE